MKIYLKEEGKPERLTKYNSMAEAIGKLTRLQVENFTLIEVNRLGQRRVIDSNNIPSEYQHVRFK